MNVPARHPGPGWPSGYLPQARVRMRLEELGGSRRVIGASVEKRPLEAWEWTLAEPRQTGSRDVRGAESSSARSESNPGAGILLLALVHPMEWIGQLAALAVVEDLVRGTIRVPPRTHLRVLPVANPDGVARVESGLLSGTPRWVRGNARGVDLNRNFSVAHRCRPRWMDVFPMWCPGPSPASEPETEAVETWARSAAFDVAISFHSFGRWIFHPPAHVRTRNALSARHGLALGSARQRLAHGWTPYRTAPLGRWSWWFRAYGTEIDFLAAQPGTDSRARGEGSLAYLIEVSRGGVFRWGARRTLHPFYWFNPPDPATELRLVGPRVGALLESALTVERTLDPGVPGSPR